LDKKTKILILKCVESTVGLRFLKTPSRTTTGDIGGHQVIPGTSRLGE